MEQRGLLQPLAFPTEESQPKDGVHLVGIREFIESPDYLGKKDQVWPGVKLDLEAMCRPAMLGAIIEQGIGGGKSYRVAFKEAYDVYRLAYQEIILGVNPRPHYGLDPDSVISVANVSLNAKQAKKVVFGYVANLIDHSPWFREYMPRDTRINSEVRFLDRDYSIFPGHGHQSSVIGLNLFTCIIDEANFFTRSEGSNSSGLDYVVEMWDAIESRIRSRFGLDGFLGVISSRRTVDDFTARKRRALESDPETAQHYYLPTPRPAWEDWPQEKKRSLPSGGPCLWRRFDETTCTLQPEKRTYEEIEESAALWVPQTLWGPFATNPEAAMRDHASVPSEAISPFIRRRDRIIPDWEMESPVLPGVKPTDWAKPRVQFDDLVADWFWGDPEERYHFHVDLGAVRDAAGFAVSRHSGSDQVALSGGERRPERVAIIDLELLLQIKAPPKGEIEFSLIRRLIYWLQEERGFRFHKSSYDGWQSRDSQQTLKRKGYLIEELSVDRNQEAYTNLKEALYEGRLFFPPAHGQTAETPWEQVLALADKGDPCAVFQKELSRLEDIKGKKVDHPPHGSKDVCDAAAGAVTNAIRNPRLGRDLL